MNLIILIFFTINTISAFKIEHDALILDEAMVMVKEKMTFAR